VRVRRSRIRIIMRLKSMKILKTPITIEELSLLAKRTFGDMVKAVVDIDRKMIAIDAELHSDLESLLLENGSEQDGLWGVNFYPEIEGDDFIEFDSMINLRPSQGNMTRSVDSEDIRSKIRAIVNNLVKR
jgi:hypothetical protein